MLLTYLLFLMFFIPSYRSKFIWSDMFLFQLEERPLTCISVQISWWWTLSLCLSKKSCFFPLILIFQDIFTGFRTLVWQLFSFRTLKMSFHYLIACILSNICKFLSFFLCNVSPATLRDSNLFKIFKNFFLYWLSSNFIMYFCTTYVCVYSS